MNRLFVLIASIVLMSSITAAQAQSFNANHEADAFLNRIASLNTQSRHMLQVLVESELDSFVLAVKSRRPVFSASGNVSLSGTISFEDRITASRLLAPKLRARDTERNPALRMLNGMVEQNAKLTPSQAQELRRFFNDTQR